MMKSYYKYRIKREIQKLPEIYQIIYGFDELSKGAKRSCQDRLKVIADRIHPNSNVYDLGCQIGYFSFSLAEKGHTVKGYELESILVKIANLIKKYNGLNDNPIFQMFKVTSQSVEQLPEADYVLFLSVLHHIIGYEGYDEGLKVLKAIKRITRRNLFFETGQSNEKGLWWSDKLPDMGEDPKEFLVQMLQDAGFENAEIIGTFPTHLADINRYLICAS